jgi:hypothetical protein
VWRQYRPPLPGHGTCANSAGGCFTSDSGPKAFTDTGYSHAAGNSAGNSAGGCFPSDSSSKAVADTGDSHAAGIDSRDKCNSDSSAEHNSDPGSHDDTKWRTSGLYVLREREFKLYFWRGEECRLRRKREV